jgi:photosystem II stability/assembly factor-like uncharacterized protein
MKRFFFVILFSWSFCLDVKGQIWTRMQGWGLDLQSIHWINDQKVVAAGENLIIYSEDGGATWKEAEQVFGFRFFDLSFLGESLGVAVGENGNIYRSSDGGKSWNKVASGTSKQLKSIISLGASQLFAVGEEGTLLSSIDSGVSWNRIPINTSLDFQEVFFVDQNTGFIAAEAGTIFKSSDKGQSWEKIQVPTDNNLSGIAFSTPLNGYVVGDQGVFYRTSDGGKTWILLNSLSKANLKRVVISPLDNRILIAIGDQASVVRSINSGTSFGLINLGSGFSGNLNSLEFKPNSNLVLLTGENGFITSSSNSGANWATRQLGNRIDFSVTDFKTSIFGFFAGNNGSVFLTSNGAQTLQNRSIPDPIDLLSLEFWNTSYGFVAGTKGEIYRTSNAGTSWVRQNSNSSLGIKGIHIFIPEVPYVVGEKGLIARTFTSGNEWQLIQNTNTKEDLNDITAFDLQTAFAVGNNGQVSWSNNGVDWENIASGSPENLNFATRLDTASAIAVGNNGLILKTIDKGRTWIKIESGVRQNINSVDFFDSQYGFAVGDFGLTLVTKDGGESWTKIESATTRDLKSVSATGISSAFSAGKDGTILGYSCSTPGTLSQISGNTTDCLGSSIYKITNQPEAGSEIVWRVDGGIIISGQGSSTIEIEWTKTGRNAVLVSRSNFCGNGKTSALEVLTNKKPEISSPISGDGSVCINKIYTYSVGNQPGHTFTWEITGGEIQSGQGTSIVSVVWKSTGDQRISVIASAACGKSEAKTKTIRSSKAPDQPASIQGESLVALGETRYSTTSIPGLNYKWSISEGGKISSGQGTASVSVLWEKEGIFEVSVEAQNECDFGPKRTFPVTVNIITAMEPNPEPVDIVVFPNPSLGNVTVQSSQLDNYNTIQIVNSLGQILHQSTIKSQERHHELFDLPKGVHFLVISGKKGTTSKKILVK